MTTKFFAILTHLGAAKLANATALGTQLQITHMAVGDGGGVLPLPNAAQTQLIGEKRRAALNSLSVDAANNSQIIAEQVIPETDGGWWIREIGLFDKDGVLIAIANCPETYKPQLQEGSGRTQTVRMVLIVSSTEAVTLKIDPSVVLATRKYVDDQVIEVKAYADGLMAAHLAAADPHSQYAPKASPALTGKPTAPTAAKADNSTQLATTAHVKQVATDYAPLASPALTGKPTAPTAAKADNSTQLATTAHVKQVATDYAPLASPALTGTPTTPTAAAGNSTQQLANTAFVQAAIAALVASSPAALDTLKELADALGNDPNFATTMTNALAGKMDKAKSGSDIANVATFLANLGLTDIGIGLPNMSDIANFDWQNFPFRSGANYTTNYNTWVNPPDGVTYNAGTRVSIRVTYISNLASGPRMGLELTPDTGAATNFKVYRLLCVGAAGSRVFTFNQDWNSANPVPISGGGTGAATAAEALVNLGLGDVAHLSQLTGVVGTARNARMSVTVASATATFAAEELIVQAGLGWLQYKLAGFNKSVNLGITGAGGMDTGSAPANGFVALYVIYNPTTQGSALLAVNATSTVAPEVCMGVMPAGYTASALVSVWGITSSLFRIGFQSDRHISIPTINIYSVSGGTTTQTVLGVSPVAPPNAKQIDIALTANETVAGNGVALNIASSTSGIGQFGAVSTVTGQTATAITTGTLALIESQRLYFSMSNTNPGTYIIAGRGYSL